MGRSADSLILSKMRSAIFFFFFIFLVSSSYAYDCNTFSGQDYTDCMALNPVNENLIANIVYKNTSFPDHEFVNNYNKNIAISAPPNNTVLNNSEVIQNAWISILTISPSIFYDNKTYVSKITDYRAESGYAFNLPAYYYYSKQVNGRTCQILYTKNSEQSSINWIIDGKTYGAGKNIQVISDNYNLVQAQANIQAVTRADTYVWKRTCCKKTSGYCQKYCYNCQYSSTSYTTNTLILKDSVFVTNYNHDPTAEFTITENYADTYKGFLEKDNQTNVVLNFNSSYFKDQEFIYYANFSKQPYNFVYLIAEKRDSKASKNLIISNGNFYVHDASNCTIEKSDFFAKQTGQCKINITETAQNIATPNKTISNLSLLIKILVFAFILFIIHKLIKKSWGKTLVPLACLLLMIPSVSAAEDCGITNLASCIPQKIYEFFLNLLNAPLEPLLNLVKNLLANSPSINIFQGVWAIIVYCISLFYGLLFVYAGFLFLFSGHDVMRREMAKEWLKNTVIMIVLIQASFYLYGLFIDLGSIMASTILSMVDPHFFMLTADNLTNVGLEFLFILIYALVLIITLLFLTMRYLIVACGVLFLPIGIFCYFIPPLKSYGKLILNLIGMLIFITFIDAIIILACSMLISLPAFQNIKILVMITCFIIIDLLFVMLGKHIISKTSLDEVAGKAMQAGKYIATML